MKVALKNICSPINLHVSYTCPAEIWPLSFATDVKEVQGKVSREVHGSRTKNAKVKRVERILLFVSQKLCQKPNEQEKSFPPGFIKEQERKKNQ